MLDVTPIVPLKYKRRKVSAIRDFPKGCGQRALVANSKPLGEPPVSIQAELITVSKLNEALAPVSALELLPVVEAASLDRGSLKDEVSIPKFDDGEIWKGLKPLDSAGSLETHEAEEERKVALGDVGNPRGFAEDVMKLETSEQSKENLGEPEPSIELGADAVVENQGRSRLYPPPKRRKFSAVRHFPPGCGRDAPPMKRQECMEGSNAVACSESKNLDGEERTQVGEKADAGGSNGLLPIENGEGQVIIDENKQPELMQDITGELHVEMSRSDPEKTKPGVGSHAATSIKSLDKENLVARKHVIAGAADGDASEDIAEGENGTQRISEIMQIQDGAGEISGKAQVDHALGNVFNETMEDEQYQKKVMLQPGTQKELVVHDANQVKKNLQIKELVMHDANQVKQNLQIKELVMHEANQVKQNLQMKELVVHDVDQVKKKLKIKVVGHKPYDPKAKSPSGSKLINNEARSLVVKAVDEGTSNLRKESENLKRKMLEEVENKGHVKKDQKRGLEAYAERLVMQALMAAENCPWRTKSNAAGSRSVTPKPKVKKGGKSLGVNFASVEASASRIKDRMVVEEEEDSLPEEHDAKKALVLYQGPNELEVTLFPVVPYGVNYENSDSPEVAARKSVKKILRIFRFVCWKLSQVKKDNSRDLGRRNRIDLNAADILKLNNGWVNTGKPIIGAVPGVEVGDEFQYRVELSIVGLHRPFQGGIDSTKIDGEPVATSIVASGGYPDDIDSSDVLIYSGSGGNPVKAKEAGDQKLERGNLALKNSIAAKTPVRVIYGFKELKGADSSHDGRSKIVSTFTYDGLYLVEEFWQEKGSHGFLVFKFKLRKIAGQPELALKEVKKSKKSKMREGLCVKDISDGREKLPICAVNTVDDERPPPFVYITNMMYPSWYTLTPSTGCGCTGRCSDLKKCACSAKNGGEIPFNFDGAIVIAKPLVYECGPKCKCPPSCYNRVSQHGLKINLEIFKTKSRGWGVRSLSSIPSGSFICEYIGELLHDREAEQQVGNDEYLFDIGRNYDDISLWEGLPSFIPGVESAPQCERVNDVGLTIDAAKYGNVGRFINHSCSPNLYAQNVLYDHDDKNVPHIMFFAADNIPPMQELTYHYNYQIGEVRDSDGTIRVKNCYCGALDCSGRLY